MKFTIDETHLTSITIRKEYDMYRNTPKDELTNEQLVRIIKGDSICTTISNEDHPEFAKLRNMLGEQGYIHIERGWVNGDRVIKPFTLNDIKFKKGDRFVSAGAMGVAIRVAKQCSKKYNPRY